MKHILHIFIVCIALCGFFVGEFSSYAAEDTFHVQQVITDGGVDNEDPSVPINLVATAVSSSQIDLSWIASTDNDSVEGYQVFRDLLFIATSTAITYSDTGLNPKTLYTYTVTAFDPTINISGNSATATATTLAAPVGDEDDDSSSGGFQNILLLNLSVEPGLYNTLVSFETNVYTQAMLSWGTTVDYEMGTIAGSLFLKDHSISIEGLTPNTLYFFKLELVDAYGKKLILDNQQFTASALIDTAPPTNIKNLKAVGDDEVIVLTWNNPPVDFDSVRIVKSEIFYPKDLFDGEVIYEGSLEKFIDTEVVYGKVYYYTVFVKDTLGNYSSGAIAKARLYKIGEPIDPDNIFDGVKELPISQVHPLISALTIFDLDFFQNGKKILPSAGIVRLEGDREFLISLDYSKVPEILKTITVTMRDPKDPSKTFSFLLRVNKEKTAYEAHIAPLGQSGDFAFGVSILDYKNQGLKKIAGVIVASMPEFTPHPDISSGTLWIFIQKNILGLPLLIIIVCLIYLSYRSIRALFERRNQ